MACSLLKKYYTSYPIREAYEHTLPYIKDACTRKQRAFVFSAPGVKAHLFFAEQLLSVSGGDLYENTLFRKAVQDMDPSKEVAVFVKLETGEYQHEIIDIECDRNVTQLGKANAQLRAQLTELEDVVHVMEQQLCECQQKSSLS